VVNIRTTAETPHESGLLLSHSKGYVGQNTPKLNLSYSFPHALCNPKIQTTINFCNCCRL